MNPFHKELDRSLRGKVVQVDTGNGLVYRGTVNRMNHHEGDILLQSARVLHKSGKVPLSRVDKFADWTDVGNVYVSDVDALHTVPNQHARVKDIIYPDVADIDNSPYYPLDDVGTPPDDHMRGAYRNGFTGSFPVVRPVNKVESSGGPEDHTGREVTRFELINGHKRIEACRMVGLERHPVEVIECTDEQAEELVKIAHRKMIEREQPEPAIRKVEHDDDY